jgi:hypothetical protein
MRGINSIKSATFALVQLVHSISKKD